LMEKIKWVIKGNNSKHVVIMEWWQVAIMLWIHQEQITSC
jgi:hypothetical protein